MSPDLVVGAPMLLVTVGATIGLIAALAASRLVSGLVFGLTPNDPVTMAAAVLALLSAAAVAGYVPARRAARVDRLAALRYE